MEAVRGVDRPRPEGSHRGSWRGTPRNACPSFHVSASLLPGFLLRRWGKVKGLSSGPELSGAEGEGHKPTPETTAREGEAASAGIGAPRKGGAGRRAGVPRLLVWVDLSTKQRRWEGEARKAKGRARRRLLWTRGQKGVSPALGACAGDPRPKTQLGGVLPRVVILAHRRGQQKWPEGALHGRLCPVTEEGEGGLFVVGGSQAGRKREPPGLLPSGACRIRSVGCSPSSWGTRCRLYGEEAVRS